MTKFCHCLILILFAFTARAQSTDSLFKALAAKLALNDTATHADLFVHFNKSVYTAGENAWFAAYVLNAERVEGYQTLYMALLNITEQRVVSSSRYVLEQGLASASFSIPDSVVSGKYCWVAYTNKSIAGQSSQVFRQPIEILSSHTNAYDVQFTGALESGDIEFTGYVTQKENSKAALPAKVALTLYADGKAFQKLDANINNMGQFHFAVPAALASKRLEVAGSIGREKQQMAFRRSLTWLSGKSIVEFYAPSGKLLDGWPAQMAVSVRNGIGKHIAGQCILLEDGAEIGSFITDKTGNGSFAMIPKLGRQYTVKLKGEQEVPIQSFPAITTNAWGLRPVNTIVNDSLRLHITIPGNPGEGLLVIHNKRSVLYGAYLKLRRPEAALNIPVIDWQSGLAYVSLYTKDGTLRYRQLVMINHADAVTAVMQADAPTYKPLTKVTVKLKLASAIGQPVKGIFSFSSALEQAFTYSAKDIDVVNLFGRFMPDGATLPPASYLKNEQSIKNLLLKQGGIITDSLWNLKTLSPLNYADGYVLKNNKKPNKPVSLILFGNQSMMLQSTAEGNFTLPSSYLRLDAGKKATLSVVAKNLPDYQIELTPPEEKINHTLAGQNIQQYLEQADELSYEEKRLLSLPQNNLLKEVVVTSKKTDMHNYYGKSNTGGVCNDYVCQFDVLNCPYHAGVKAPQEGQEYNFETPMGITKVTYHCEYKAKPLYIKEVEPIYNYQPFTPFNPSDLTQADMMNSNALHWQAFVETNENGEAVISFYCNSRSGRFKAVIQGKTSNGVFSAETYFDVKR